MASFFSGLVCFHQLLEGCNCFAQPKSHAMKVIHSGVPIQKDCLCLSCSLVSFFSYCFVTIGIFKVKLYSVKGR